MCFMYCLYMTGPNIFDYIKRLIQLTVISLSGRHCNFPVKNLPISTFARNIECLFWVCRRTTCNYNLQICVNKEVRLHRTCSLSNVCSARNCFADFNWSSLIRSFFPLGCSHHQKRGNINKKQREGRKKKEFKLMCV